MLNKLISQKDTQSIGVDNMTTLLSMDEIERHILENGFTISFNFINKYIKSTDLKFEDYVLLIDLADDYKQARAIVNEMKKKEIDVPNSLKVRLFWKPIKEEHVSQQRKYYMDNFSSDIFEERLNNPVMIHYEELLKEKRLQELIEKYNEEEGVILLQAAGKRETTNSAYVRSQQVKKGALVRANYLCELDSTHSTFISRNTNKNYMEVHHLIPMEYQSEFFNSLDIAANVVCICPTCHKSLHFGNIEEIKPLLNKLINLKVNELKKYNINIEIENLYNYYSKGFKDDGGIVDE